MADLLRDGFLEKGDDVARFGGHPVDIVGVRHARVETVEVQSLLEFLKFISADGPCVSVEGVGEPRSALGDDWHHRLTSNVTTEDQAVGLVDRRRRQKFSKAAIAAVDIRGKEDSERRPL